MSQPGQSKALKFEWEYINHNTCRAKVVGGWVVADSTTSSAMTFIPDPNHE